MSYQKNPTEVLLGISFADGVSGAANTQNHVWPLPTCDIVPTLPMSMRKGQVFFE